MNLLHQFNTTKAQDLHTTRRNSTIRTLRICPHPASLQIMDLCRRRRHHSNFIRHIPTPPCHHHLINRNLVAIRLLLYTAPKCIVLLRQSTIIPTSGILHIRILKPCLHLISVRLVPSPHRRPYLYNRLALLTLNLLMAIKGPCIPILFQDIILLNPVIQWHYAVNLRCLSHSE